MIPEQKDILLILLIIIYYAAAVSCTDCSVSTHLQGAAHLVSAGCFYEREGSFQSWRAGDDGGSAQQRGRRYRGEGLYPSSGTSPQSLASDWPAGSAPPPGVCN